MKDIFLPKHYLSYHNILYLCSLRINRPIPVSVSSDSCRTIIKQLLDDNATVVGRLVFRKKKINPLSDKNNSPKRRELFIAINKNKYLMSAYYDLYETPSPDGKEDKKSLHARICPKRTYTQKEFVEHIATFQHLPKNVIGAALDACIDELCDLLANGNIVELGELGFFSTSLKCLRETDDEKKKIRSESVQFQNVHLRISSTFRNNIKKKMTLERVHSTTKKSKKVVETTEATRKAELELFLKQNVCINKNEYIQLSGLTRHAAIDELNKFIRQGFLRRRGMGRSTVYVRQEKDTANEI